MLEMNEVTKMTNTIHTNLSTDELIDIALARKEGVLAANKAFTVTTGARTGRSPKDRFVVKDELTSLTVDWNTINQPFSPEKFAALWERAAAHLASLPMFIIAN